MNNQRQTQIKTLCIPRVLSNVTKEYVHDIMNKLHLGTIRNIEIIRSKNQTYKALIHFSNWNNGGNADIVKERLLLGKDIKIVHNDPWFWKIVIFRDSKK
jgi:hypothetical protein